LIYEKEALIRARLFDHWPLFCLMSKRQERSDDRNSTAFVQHRASIAIVIPGTLKRRS